ncbi:MAG: HAD-IIIA family hydrolase [Deltaproteobacteria bacterium]|jgi:3-deoxy-D-manno-octulosonate 8-phosphate phosphatase (KDO 8-P phosphatase)|nr:HAD-IIIA family hydrolase [Deltaproteobacteria bacterium]MBW1854810.1 HAD-IIIA family hydrolase [Deltaproteobacteria bacterium]
MKRVNRKKLKSVKLLMLDVDGVLTDGKIIYNDRGEEIKAFNVRDGHGLKLLMRAGIEIALITGRKSKVVLHRARDLGIKKVYQGVINKIEIYEKILKEKKLKDINVGFVGDDLVDIPVLKRVGFSAAVGDAIPEVKKVVDYVASKRGGEGAVREICELLLKVQNKWEGITERYRDN